MKCVFSAPTITEVYMIKSVLENEGIITHVKNEHTAGLAGEVPFFEAWPQLCVEDDGKAEEAETIIENFQKALPDQDPQTPND